MMDRVSFDRWRDFAVRMARACYGRSRRPSGAWVLEMVERYFDCLGPDEVLATNSWDQENQYPEGCESYERRYRVPCWHCSGVKREDCPHGCEDGHIYDYAHADYVCDAVSNLLDEECPSFSIDDDKAWNQWQDQFGGPVRCCIRAGLDLVGDPSAGVIGFTVADLKKMYPEGVPAWVKGDRRWCPWMKPDHDESECHWFDEMADDEVLVL